MSTDRELLEMAANAAGMTGCAAEFHSPQRLVFVHDGYGSAEWNPLTDDGDALRLAVRLGLSLRTTRGFEPDESVGVSNSHELHASFLHQDDPYAATRRAIVRAAAEIGKVMK